jgi:hypothetical protein
VLARPCNRELRFQDCGYFIDLLIEELKEQRPAIKSIGIDLDAWIQTFLPKAENGARHQ